MSTDSIYKNIMKRNQFKNYLFTTRQVIEKVKNPILNSQTKDLYIFSLTFFLLGSPGNNSHFKNLA